MDATISDSTVDDLIPRAFQNIRTGVEAGKIALSSELTLRFLFVWELGRLLGFSDLYRFDFEVEAFSDTDTDDRFLDLLVWTEPEYKVACEFKLPKRGTSGSNTTQARAKMCRDISRLSYLVRKGVFSIKAGYFLCATNEGSYLTAGRKEQNLQYKVHHRMVYPPGAVLPPREHRNGIPRPLQFPNHEVAFIWEGIRETGIIVKRLTPEGRFAWLRPVRVSG
ncbi:MAG: hypothetical protein KGS09_20785 [Nitrospirae bacterium]|nr:hypothetical protein [Nitrospirota bacterium]MBU6482963.1 hypothetical protein [Nitrospirota bacterium]MDE3041579.1 hypothetical protein [Nitrospirota bacterium]MDE3050780.1 hypothetical protein [Nitrospirota bacterium]